MIASPKPVALVTGATSGIGLATALALRDAGYHVYGTTRGRGTERPADIEMLVCDVANDRAVASAVARIIDETGRIDVLVNNAGLGLGGAAEEASLDRAKALFDVNFFGTLRMIRAVLPIMRRQQHGRIINISSVLGLIPAPFMALYAATKHAMEGYSESLDHEVRAMGIRVLLVEPAFTRTAFDANAMPPDAPLAAYAAGRSSFDAALARSMARGDLPETVAATVLRAVTDARPKLRYPAGKLAGQVSMLRRLVPAAAFDKSVRKQNGLPA